MPWVKDKHDGDRYAMTLPHMALPAIPGEANLRWLERERVRLIQARDELLGLKKLYGRELGRFLKDEERDVLKAYRGLLWVIRHWNTEPPGDAAKATVTEEIAAWADHYFGCATFMEA